MADDEKVSTPVGEQPTRGGADGRDASRGVPGGSRRGDRVSAEAVTVEQLLARQGSSVTGRRAARRVEEAPVRRSQDPPPSVRAGLPPVPGAPAAAVHPPRLPPVPAAAGSPAPGRTAPAPTTPGRPAPPPRLPPVPAAPRPAESWEPSRRSVPIPPLPGLAPPT